MRLASRPALAVLFALAVPTLSAFAAVMPFSGSQGPKAVNLDDLVNQASTPPVVQTGAGSPGAAKQQFLSHVETLGVLGFEASPAGAPGTIGFGTNKATFSGGATVIDGSAALVDFTVGRYNMTPAPQGSPAILGKWLETTSTFSIQFESAIGGFGFFGTDFNDWSGTLLIKLFDVNDQQIEPNSKFSPVSSDGSNAGLVFFGLTSTTPFSKITFDITQGGAALDTLGFDEIVFGTFRNGNGNGVPEPATLALTATSLVALAALRRRRND